MGMAVSLIKYSTYESSSSICSFFFLSYFSLMSLLSPFSFFLSFSVFVLIPLGRLLVYHEKKNLVIEI